MRKRKIAFSCLCFVLASIVAFSLGEIYIRQFVPLDKDDRYELTGDPVLFYRLKASVEGVHQGARFTHTRQHTRGPKTYLAVPAPDAQRILWLGDSACYGTLVADDETAPFQMEQLARQEGRTVESINLAVVGYNVRQIREVLHQRSGEFSGAEAIIYYHHENDIINATWVAMAPHLPSSLRSYERPQSIWKAFLKRSALIHRLGRTELVASLLDIPPPDARQLEELEADARPRINSFSRLCLSLYEGENRWARQFRHDLYLMADKAAAIGARLIVVYWPTVTAAGHPEYERTRAVLREWCGVRNIEWIDMTEAFSNHRAHGLYSDTTHPGVRGHALVAEQVWNALKRKEMPTH